MKHSIRVIEWWRRRFAWFDLAKWRHQLCRTTARVSALLEVRLWNILTIVPSIASSRVCTRSDGLMSFTVGWTHGSLILPHSVTASQQFHLPGSRDIVLCSAHPTTGHTLLCWRDSCLSSWTTTRLLHGQPVYWSVCSQKEGWRQDFMFKDYITPTRLSQETVLRYKWLNEV